jgi:hypothetical protein
MGIAFDVLFIKGDASRKSTRKRSPSNGLAMARLRRRWATPGVFGDLSLLVFVLVQALDGGLTYAGVRIWGPGIEANPLISSAIMSAGPGMGLASAKLMAVGFGMVLHLHQTHVAVALLTVFYLVVAILPWTALFLTL